MSVIIRLQNLPWNANALDIRRFFQGLSIPDGGVHIVGGEKGDAFIAFSTDEDARQAMMKDNGYINGYSVKLLLSSKTEMQNVISAAKGGPTPTGPPPSLPAASNVVVPTPTGFYDAPAMPPVGGAPVPYLGGVGGGDVTGSGQGLRSSTGLGSFPVPYGYPGNSPQVISAQPTPSVLRFADQTAMPPAPELPPAARSIFETRPSDRPPIYGNLQQPSVAPMDPVMSGLRLGIPPPLQPVGAWTASQPPVNQDIPPQQFVQPPNIPGNQGVGYNAFNPSAGREPVRLDGGHPDVNYSRNGHAYGAPDSGRNFMSGVEPGRNLGGPPADVRRDFGRGDSGAVIGRPEEQRDPGRFVGDRPGWVERDAGRLEMGPGQGWSSSGRPGGGRDIASDSRREFMQTDVERGMPASDNWMENRSRGSRDILPNEGPPPRPGPLDSNDRHGAGRPPVFYEGSGSRFGPDGGPPSMGGMPESRFRGDSYPDPGFREPPRHLMDEQLPQPPPPDRPWLEDRRGYGPPPPERGFAGRPLSPPRDHPFPGARFPSGDNEPWFDDRRDFDQRQMRDPGSKLDLCIRAENFPKSFNYRDVRRFFTNCTIPHDDVKMINDRNGMRSGVAYVRMADARSVDNALSMHGKFVEDCMISITRCNNQEFDTAKDGVPMIIKRPDRSRSPRSRHADGSSNVLYLVVKKVPPQTEKDDIRKFFGKFRITADGGPFFELAYDKSPTGIALVAIEEKDHSKVMALHRTMLNGARVDVIKISLHEFAERSRRYRQHEQAANKGVGQSKSSSSSSLRDKKPENLKQDPKPKEQDRAGNAKVEDDDGRRQSGSDPDQRMSCVEVRGLPYISSPAMIQRFFSEIDIPPESIYIVYNREQRCTGIAYIEFSSIADQQRALEKDKKLLGHRVIELRSMRKMAMVEEYNKQQQKFGGTPISVRSTTDRSKQGSDALLSMQNLHFDTQLEDILEFFTGYHPIIDSIKLQYKDGQPTGDGLVAFRTLQEAESVLRNKNRHMLLGKPVTLMWPKK